MSTIHFLAGRGVMVMAASTRAQELMVAEASVQPLRWHVTLTWGAVQPWSVPPPWRTRINHKIQKRIAIKQDRSDPRSRRGGDGPPPSYGSRTTTPHSICTLIRGKLNTCSRHAHRNAQNIAAPAGYDPGHNHPKDRYSRSATEARGSELISQKMVPGDLHSRIKQRCE